MAKYGPPGLSRRVWNFFVWGFIMSANLANLSVTSFSLEDNSLEIDQDLKVNSTIRNKNI